MIERTYERTARVATFCVGHATYWGQFEGLLDSLLGYHGEMVQKIKANGIKTAILSNKFDGAVKALSKEYFGDLIDLPLGEGNGIKVKPDPDGMNYVLDTFGIDKSRCLYVGDSEVDVVTALGVDIDFAVVTWGFRDKDVLKSAGATLFVDTTEQLEKVIFE